MAPCNLDAKLAAYVPSWVRTFVASPAAAETAGPLLMRKQRRSSFWTS